MIEENYVPKYYKCSSANVIDNQRGTSFVFNVDGKSTKFDVDQPYSVVSERIQEILHGKRNILYLTDGMRDIDVERKSNGIWQLFDEFDIYEFTMQ